SRPELQPACARFQTQIFPDNPLALDGMDLLYLNSEKAPELRSTQADAIHAWLLSGGHLVVAVEQSGDINSVPWLKALAPCQPGEMVSISNPWSLQHWLKTSALTRGERRPAGGPPSSRPGSEMNPYESLPPDVTFESNALQVATCQIRDGTTI